MTLNPAWRAYRPWLSVVTVSLPLFLLWAFGMQSQPARVMRYPTAGLKFVMAAGLGVGLVSVAGIVRLWFFRCPRCGGLFHQKSIFTSVPRLGAGCPRCGLEKWQDPTGASP